MAINKHHEAEELNGIKCAIVEKNADVTRAAFLSNLLEANGYTAIVAAPPAKPAAAVPAPESDTPSIEAPSLFTVGVTDLTFNPVNAIFGRLLKTREGQVVTMAYWKGAEPFSQDDVPYFADGNRWGRGL